MGFSSFCILSRGHLCLMLGYFFYKETIYSAIRNSFNQFLFYDQLNFFFWIRALENIYVTEWFWKIASIKCIWKEASKFILLYKERIRHFEQWQEVNYLPFACGFCKAVSNAISSHPNGFIEIRLWFWVQ